MANSVAAVLALSGMALVATAGVLYGCPLISLGVVLFLADAEDADLD